MLTNERLLEDVLSRMCAEYGCMNYVEPGYVCCEGHLYGFPKQATPEEQKIKRDWEEMSQKKGESDADE